MNNKLLLIAFSVFSTSALAADLTVDMTDLATGKSAGTIEISQNQYGSVFTPALKGLTPGLHGFHIHVNPSCDTSTKDDKTVLGGAAGGHYDPANTGQHGTPWGDNNHLGDLPPIYADSNGDVVQPVMAPRVELADLPGRALMIHAGGDNHSDSPNPLGGGGARVICGVIK